MERHHRGVLKDINGHLNMNPSQIRDVNQIKKKSENYPRHDRSLLLHEDSSSSDDYRSAEEEDEAFNMELDLMIKGINSVHILTPTARKLKTQLQRSYSLNKTIDLDLSQKLAKEIEIASENKINDSRNDEVFESILNESENRLSTEISAPIVENFVSIVNQPENLPVDNAITECFTKTNEQVVIQQNTESNNIHNSTMLDTKTTNVAEALSNYMLPDHDMSLSENKSLDLSNINKSIHHEECENLETNKTLPVSEVPCILEDTLTDIKESEIRSEKLDTVEIQNNSEQNIDPNGDQFCEEKSGDNKDIQINNNNPNEILSKELLTNKEDKVESEFEELCGSNNTPIKSQNVVDMTQMLSENEKNCESILPCIGYESPLLKDCTKSLEKLINENANHLPTINDNEKLYNENMIEVNTNSDLNHTAVVNLEQNSVNIGSIASLNDIIDSSCKTTEISSEHSLDENETSQNNTVVEYIPCDVLDKMKASNLDATTIITKDVIDNPFISDEPMKTVPNLDATTIITKDVIDNPFILDEPMKTNPNLDATTAITKDVIDNPFIPDEPMKMVSNLDATTTITKDVINNTLDETMKTSKINFNLNETITLDSNMSEDWESVQQLDGTIIINDNKTSLNDFIMGEQSILNSPDDIFGPKKISLDTTLTLNEERFAYNNSANDYIASIKDKKINIPKEVSLIDTFGSPLINPHNFENTPNKPNLNLVKEMNLAFDFKKNDEQTNVIQKSSGIEDRNDKFNLSKNSLKMFEDFESTRIKCKDTIVEMKFPDEFDWHNDLTKKNITQNKSQITKNISEEYQKNDPLINFDVSNTNNPDIVITNISLNNTNVMTGPNLLIKNDVSTEINPIIKNSKDLVTKERPVSPKSSSGIFKWIGQFLSPNKSLTTNNDENLSNNEELLDKDSTINDALDQTKNCSSILRSDSDFVKLIDETPFSEFMSVSTTSEPFNESRANNEEQFDYLNEIIQLRQLVAQNDDKLKGVRLQIESYHNKANELEHSIQMHERKLIEKEERERIIGITVNNFEKRVKELSDEYESAKKANESELKMCQEERDKAQDHLSSVESAFSDLHKKYEQCKGVIELLKTNQEIRKSSNSNLRDVAMEQKTLLGMLEEQAAGQIKTAVADFESNKHQHKVEMVKWTALIKKAELRKESLQEALTKKQDENRELIELCDGLIQKVG